MPRVTIEQLAGCIKWLPPKEDLVPIDANIDDGCCNHPVVILSTVPRDRKVDILIITSLGGLDLEARYPNQPSARHDHLPIAPSRAHPDNGTLLVLKDLSFELRKRSYVKTRTQHTILLSSLKPYDRHGPEVFLSKRSYKVLVKHVQYSEPTQVPSLDTLRYGHITQSTSTRHDIERSVAIKRSGPAEDVAFLYQQMRASYNRNSRADHSLQIPKSYYNTQSARITTSSSERQSLLYTKEDRRPRPYRGHSVLPSTHQIRADYRSDASEPFDWENFIKCVKVIMTICFVLPLYALYLGGRWVVTTYGRVLDWKKKTRQSVVGKIQSISSSLSHYLGY
ncbi:hypothetical protein ANO14919_108820 [Xylariales sp. No.14919]|nr:hypothetical protein ANO14919_108820 [Xylariales sp. No.14919]